MIAPYAQSWSTCAVCKLCQSTDVMGVSCQSMVHKVKDLHKHTEGGLQYRAL